MKKILVIASIAMASLFSKNIMSGQPTCHTHSGGPYCSYVGKVQRIYVNDSNFILIYFDTALPEGETDSVGISGVSQRTATVYRISDNPEFATMFYSTALAAQASGREITIQMRNTLNGYLKFDRIWLAAP